ncbi:MAG: FAD-dependent oxidoreductase [Chlamydiales bacterium]|nr:FAD-dependent oxidoreductase [Chlamydiales bacterium]
MMKTECCIVGGGPAGIMLGYMLARAGIETTVLEKYPDFFRDFRGDTIHPSTMEVLYELGLLDEFLTLPHNKMHRMMGEIGGQRVTMADFSHLNVRCPFIAFIPQWDFLNFIVEKAKSFPTFHLLMQTEATNLIEKEGKIVGVTAKSPAGNLEIHSELVIGADGRHSRVREKSGLTVQTFGAPMDVLWFRISRRASDPQQTLGKIDMGHMMVMIERGDYWQCGYLIAKGGIEKIKSEGIEAFQKSIRAMAPLFSERIGELRSFDDVHLLTVMVDRLEKWYRPGLLCIGDAAHAMSPIGGVGINLAIQDAVAAANILIPAFLQQTLQVSDLAKVQKRRLFPTLLIQKVQIFIQSRVIDRILKSADRPSVPFIIKLMQRFPYLQRIPAYLIGIGPRPEHIER